MSILTPVRYSIRPEKTTDFESIVARVADRARERDEDLHWTCGQVIAGNVTRYSIVMSSETLAEAAERDSSAVLMARLFGEEQGQKMQFEIGECIAEVQSSMLRDRLELSYPGEQITAQPIAIVLLRAEIQPGQQIEAEELFRKVAEAIPKVGDARRFTVWQPVIGNLGEIFSVRPVFDLSELDEVGTVPELLTSAFGASQAKKMYKAGLESLASVETELLLLREDLSHPMPL